MSTRVQLQLFKRTKVNGINQLLPASCDRFLAVVVVQGVMGRGHREGSWEGLKKRKGTWVASTCKANQLHRDYSRKSEKKTSWLKAEPLLCEWFKPRGNNVTSRLRKGSSVGLIATAEETVCVSDFLMRVQIRRNERLFGDAICIGPIRLHCSPLSTFWTTEDGTVPTLITLTFTLNSYVLGLRTQNSLPCFHDYPYEVSPILTFSCVLTDKSVVILTRYHTGVSLAYCLVDRFPDEVERFSLTLKWLRLNKT